MRRLYLLEAREELLVAARYYHSCEQGEYGWAFFSNHYHFVGLSPAEGAKNLEDFMREFHSRSARWVKLEDDFDPIEPENFESFELWCGWLAPAFPDGRGLLRLVGPPPVAAKKRGQAARTKGLVGGDQTNDQTGKI